MNTSNELDRIVQGFLEDRVAAPPPPDGLRDVLDQTAATPQARRRFLGRWLDRDEGAGRRITEHDHPPKTNRRTRLMFSATGIIAALAIVALSVSVIDTAPTPPEAAGATHVVAADGTGEYATIADAVAAAEDGDAIVIRPGTYTEAIVIDKDIALVGDGPREEVVITAPDDGPTYALEDGPTEPYALAFVGSSGRLSGVTLRGLLSRVVVAGGSPTLADLHLDTVGEPYVSGDHIDRNAIAIGDGSTVTIQGSLLEVSGPIGVFRADPVVEGNVLEGGPHIWGWFGDEAVIRENTVTGASSNAIVILSSGPMIVESNTLIDAAQHGISISPFLEPSGPTISDNVISGSQFGIMSSFSGTATISGNHLTDNGIGVSLHRNQSMVIDNVIEGTGAGITILGNGSPTVGGNQIDVDGLGVVIERGASPVVSGNTICGDEESLRIDEGATPTLEDNEIC